MTLPSPAERAAGSAPLGLLVFLALMTSVVALTIDAVLPALDAISADLGFADPNDRQLAVLLVFAGMGASQLVFGTLADCIGRKPAALAGWAVYLAGALACVLATTPAGFFAGRFLQGIGAGGPRIIAMAIVRDLYDGRPMARILSLVMTIFMAVPLLAPAIGQGIEALGGWRAIFGLYLGLAGIASVWYFLGVPETLAPEHRRPLSLRPVAAAIGEVLRTRVALCYTLGAVCVFGPFGTFIAMAQQILEELYGLGQAFPLAFAGLAFAFMLSSFANGRLVLRLGMRRMAAMALALLIGASGSALLAIFVGWPSGVLPLPMFLGLMAAIFVAAAILFANFNALALQPLGHIAGTAAAVVMSATSLGAAAIAWQIAGSFEGSLTPMFAGFLALGLGALGAMVAAERVRR